VRRVQCPCARAVRQSRAYRGLRTCLAGASARHVDSLSYPNDTRKAALNRTQPRRIALEHARCGLGRREWASHLAAAARAWSETTPSALALRGDLKSRQGRRGDDSGGRGRRAVNSTIHKTSLESPFWEANETIRGKHLAARRGPERGTRCKKCSGQFAFSTHDANARVQTRVLPRNIAQRAVCQRVMGTASQRDGRFTPKTTGRRTCRRGIRTGRLEIVPGPPSRGFQLGHPRARWTCAGDGKRVRVNAGTIGTGPGRRDGTSTVHFSEVHETYGWGILQAPRSQLRLRLGILLRPDVFSEGESALTERWAQPWTFSHLTREAVPKQNLVTRRGSWTRPILRGSVPSGRAKRCRGETIRPGNSGFFHERREGV